jgi:hypothetical protein
MVPERAVGDGATAIADWDNAHDCVGVVLGRMSLAKKTTARWAAKIYTWFCDVRQTSMIEGKRALFVCVTETSSWWSAA